ncbi:hypothetical protein TRFO_35748 [Tritrichomonas foetus]|uniref:Uncharacterized protein n=1 Tax=Tritrichomonas foetus TaxID=1144522 RepID=A0A1J4JK35_9EUKA|nr:hypothetical protein TRFO_35748 [Tritrichomonas foetus]|eukprot:OHS97917.1 hypothetical protein TRFO_35748 [Tritrichomonas foetus]
MTVYYIQSLINPQFFGKYIHLFDSPDKEEHSLLQSTLITLFYRFPRYKKNIIHSIIWKIIDYTEGLCYHYCVNSLLIIFYQLFETVDKVTMCKFIGLYKQYIIRLYKSSYLKEFSKMLFKVSEMFYQVRIDLAEFTLNYLTSHWPQSNSSVCVIYLKHFKILENYMQYDFSHQTIEQLFKKISLSINSDNAKIARNALKLVNDSTFMGLFKPYYDFIVPPLLYNLNGFNVHWDKKSSLLFTRIRSEMFDQNSQLTNAVPVKTKSVLENDQEIVRKKWRLLFSTVKNKANYDLSDFNENSFLTDLYSAFH